MPYPFRFPRALRLLLAAGLVLAALPAGAQQPITLAQAVAQALERNPQRAAALAESDAARAGIGEVRAAFLPQVSFAESMTRGTDPVYVFGSKLRQERFSATDFALDRLNTPAPFNNFATRLEARWNVFSSGAHWNQLQGAEHMSRAAQQQLQRAEQEIVFRVVESYLGVLRAQRQLEVAEQAVRTARAIRDRSRARVEAGIVVESDLLSAEVNLAHREQALVLARNAVNLACAQLNVAMGVPAGSEVEPQQVAETSAFQPASLEELEASALAHRPDLNSVAFEQQAQERSSAAARAEFGPKVNLFAAYEIDGNDFAGGDGDHWMGGLEIRWDLFQGGARKARLAREQARARRLEATRHAAEDAVQLDVRRAYYDFQAASRQVEVMRAARQQAEESLRINQNRYEAGLNTITDLLRVEDVARSTQSDYWAAVYQLKISHAALELATGTLDLNSSAVGQ